MGKTAASVLIPASAAEVWDAYFDPDTWAAWVDGFGGVESSEGYPQTGGTLRWRSTPAGRGDVTERVLEHSPRTVHRIEFADDVSEGELTTRFEIERADGDGAATRVTQELEYSLRNRGPLGGFTDFVFVRPQIQRSLARSLERLRHEVTELAEAREGAPPDAPL